MVDENGGSVTMSGGLSANLAVGSRTFVLTFTAPTSPSQTNPFTLVVTETGQTNPIVSVDIVGGDDFKLEAGWPEDIKLGPVVISNLTGNFERGWPTV